MRTVLRLVAVASAALMLSACSAAPASDSTPSDSTVDLSAAPLPSTVESLPEMETVRSNAAAWCALVPPSLVASTLGMELREPSASYSAEEVHCTYPPVEDGGLTIQVMFRMSQDHETFLALREESKVPGVSVADLANVGDEAYYSSSEFGDVVTNTVAARQGSVVLVVGAPNPLEDVTALVLEVLAQLA